MQGNNIATLSDNGLSASIYVSIGAFSAYPYAVYANLKPSQSAIAGEVYNVDLYEKGTFRATTTISFTQPDINIGAIKTVAFPASADEYNAYVMQDVSHIFSVKVHEPNTTTIAHTTEPTITITYPKGGETFHVGDTITIKWKSTNIRNTEPFNIVVQLSSGNLEYIADMRNTGSYEWIIPASIGGVQTIGTKNKICVSDSNGPTSGNSISSYFTIAK